MKVTMANVADTAGVNKATVSRVLRGDARISQATCEKVWAAVKQLGYRPDAVARGLSSRTNDLVGVVFRDLSSPWTGSFLSGLQRVLGRLGMDYIVKETSGDAGKGFHAVHRLLSRRVDGFVFLEDIPRETGNLPVVCVGMSNPGGVGVSVDIHGAASALKAFAGPRRIQYKYGERPLFPGLGEILQHETQGSGASLHVYDGACPEEGGTSPPDPGDDIVLCGSRGEAVYSGFWVLEFPAFEMGVLAARILVNSLRNRGARPQSVSLVPSLFSPEGELFHLS